MVKKVFVTDCEGPLTLDDNAYELAAYYIENGSELFKIISAFDDYLVDIKKEPNYFAGGTLKLITPFFKLVSLKNNDLVNYSKDNIHTVPGLDYVFSIQDSSIKSYIISTSYGQYIEALCNYINFSFENTYYTVLDLSIVDAIDEEIKKIEEFRKIILNHGNNTEEDYEVLYDIFFNQIPKMKISKIVDSVNPIGGKGKELALRDIVKKCNIEGDKNAIMYSGDSITDVEALQYAKDNEGLAISFNGNEYAINAANIAVISDNAIMTAILRDLFIKYETKEILKFVKKYHDKGPDVAFDCYEVDSNLVSQFEELYKSKEIPVMDVINDENKEYLLDLSKKMRVEIRGDDIGGLG
ncbi:MAG: hypothetical protein MJ232_05600 [archaeon]|nr:hypothetical protein [archaeon]